jgi:flagellar protein FlbD
MIPLHRLSGVEFFLNPDLILTVESTPDTLITLTNGVKLLVLETPERLSEQIRVWRRSVMAQGVV